MVNKESPQEKAGRLVEQFKKSIKRLDESIKKTDEILSEASQHRKEVWRHKDERLAQLGDLRAFVRVLGWKLRDKRDQIIRKGSKFLVLSKRKGK